MKITIREPVSALTHYIGMMLAIFASIPLLIKAALSGSPVVFAAMLVFIATMVMLYGASATYHSLTISDKVLTIFRKLDHIMIFIMIAGSYTPICLLVVGGRLGRILLITVWSVALAGTLIKAFWITCPKWFSSVLYIAMGWICIFVFKQILMVLPVSAFMLLLIGGLVYTAGGVIYALKLKVFEGHKYFGTHELFHLFVMAGSIFHFLFMYLFLA